MRYAVNYIHNMIRRASARVNLSPLALILIMSGLIMNAAIMTRLPLLFIAALTIGGWLMYTMRGEH